MSSGTCGVSMKPECTRTCSMPLQWSAISNLSGSTTTGTVSVRMVTTRTCSGRLCSSWTWLLRLCGTSSGLEARNTPVPGVREMVPSSMPPCTSAQVSRFAPTWLWSRFCP